MTWRRAVVIGLGLGFGVVLSLAAGLAGAARADAPPSRLMSPLGLLPASFVGDVVAADGPQRWQLDILPVGRFQLRRTQVDRPDAALVDTLGRYTIEGRRIALIDVDGSPLRLDLQDDGSLTVRARRRAPSAGSPAGSPAASSAGSRPGLPASLRRLDPAAPFQPVR